MRDSRAENGAELPTFVILGASKAGTSSLYHYLDQHPDVFMSPVKEPNFFALTDANPSLSGPEDENWYERSVTSIEEYLALFSERQGESVAGEASPTYLHSQHAPRTMWRYIPDAKLIAILRDPADRAYSHYCHFTRTGQESLSFWEALQCEDKRLRRGWFWPRYVEAGRYYEQLSTYLKYFDASNLKIFLFRNFVEDTENVYREILDFLEVDTDFRPDLSVRHNKSGTPKSRGLAYLLSGNNPIAQVFKPLVSDRVRNLVVQLQNLNREEPEGMKPRERRYVIQALEDDIERLEEMLGRDLSDWKTV